MKITLLHFAINDIDITEGCAAQAKGKSALYLTLDAQRIHGKTTVEHTHNTVYGKVTVIGHGDLHRLSNG